VAAVGLDERDLARGVERGQQLVAAPGEGEVVDPWQGGCLSADVAGPPVLEDGDAQDGPLVEVGDPDRAIVDLQAVGAEGAGGGS
jgi:hypothetical protein